MSIKTQGYAVTSLISAFYQRKESFYGATKGKGQNTQKGDTQEVDRQDSTGRRFLSRPLAFSIPCDLF